MIELKDLGIGIHLYNNSQNGYIIFDAQQWDGGPFSLNPRMTDTSLVLVDPNRPAGYGLEVKGDADALDSLADALKNLADIVRSQDANRA